MIEKIFLMEVLSINKFIIIIVENKFIMKKDEIDIKMQNLNKLISKLINYCYLLMLKT